MLKSLATRGMFRPSIAFLDAQKLSGTVKWFDRKKGFGFITSDAASGNAQDIFVHQTNILSATGYRMLEEGQKVAFVLKPDQKGKEQAFDVTMADGSPVKTSNSR